MQEACCAHEPEALYRVDDAFLRLRRLWSATRQNIVLREGRPVDMSGLLVVEGCWRGEERGVPVTVHDIAGFLDVAPSTASRLVDRASATGLVEKGRLPGSRTRVGLRLTTKGRDLRARAFAARLAWLQRQFEGWEPGDVAALGVLLLRFADRLEPGRP